jgi:hypothetical protein
MITFVNYPPETADDVCLTPMAQAEVEANLSNLGFIKNMGRIVGNAVAANMVLPAADQAIAISYGALRSGDFDTEAEAFFLDGARQGIQTHLSYVTSRGVTS